MILSTGDLEKRARMLLQRHAALEPTISAWAYFDPDIVLSLFSGLDRSNCQGSKLFGQAVGIKDIIDVSGMPTRHGCKLYDDAGPAQADAACVALLRQAGAIPVGKTVTAELAFAVPGKTRNPWKAGHTPGGSSSGSAAAVAAGMVPLAVGTQTGGSVIRPAAYCGVVGYKASHGAVSMAGVKRISDSFDCLGLFAHTIEQAAAAAAIWLEAPTEIGPFASDIEVATIRDPAIVAEPVAARALSSALKRLMAAGVKVSHVAIDENDFRELHQLHRAIMANEMYRNLLPEYRSASAFLGNTTKQILLDGSRIGRQEHRANLQQLYRLKKKLRTQFAHVHAIIGYSTTGTAPVGLDHTGTSVCNRVWSALGWPALHLPTEFSADGLPLGVQLIGAPHEDELLLSIGQRLHPIIDLRTESQRYVMPAI